MKPAFLILPLLLWACAPAPEREPRGSDVRVADTTTGAAPAPRADNVGEAVTAFGVALYRELADDSGNLFLSPVSIEGAFGPVLAGARGETREAIGAALRLPAGDAVHGELGGLLRGLERSEAGVTLSIANALWVQQGFSLNPEFASTARQAYDAEVESLNLTGAPAEAAARINDWVSRETRDRIRELVSAQMFNQDSRLVVTNAVYFLGDWAEAFSPEATRDEPFHLPGGGTRSVPLMARTGDYRYLEAEGFQAIDLPYKDDRLSMTIFLPSAETPFDAFENRLDPERLRGWLERLDSESPREVRLFLPRLEISESYRLVPPLTALGMGVAFTGQANLRGIADADLMISDVVHKTFLKIDEKGTEAAAATGVLIKVTGARIEQPVFRADRPFFFLIRDNETGTLLFLGRIMDPKG